MPETLQEATAQGWLDVDMTEGPNPIGSRLLSLWPEDGWVRHQFGLGNRENLVEPDAVHDPTPVLAVEGDPFPYRASARAERPAESHAVRRARAERFYRTGLVDPAVLEEEIEAARASAALAAAVRHQQATVVDEEAAHQARLDELGPVVVAGLISTTPTGSINLRLRKPEAGQ